MRWLVGVLDTPSGKVEEIAIESDTHSQSHDDPLRQDRILQAVEQASDHAASDPVSGKGRFAFEAVTSSSLSGRQRVVNGGELELVLDGGEHSHHRSSAMAPSSEEHLVEPIRGNLERVQRRRGHHATETASPR